ncbi:MAG: RNA polymerase subunit sigma-70 [Acidobacteria bacterium]|nr:MAG: RNA polymerase subunit sigma-70 [Acidobacteriota bacterium]REK00878.1 MAG: RNA polymerase subunit sigma-70 [Acidobacteriota bacterium]
MTGQPVTHLLERWREGDSRALDELMPVVYDELRRVAARRMRDERPGHTLAPTDLLHEAYGRLVQADIPWQDRAHFFAVAAGTMRRILVDHARGRAARKRGGDAVRVTLDDSLPLDAAEPETLLALHEALERLAELDQRKARVLELHLFAGLSYDETAAALDVSAATVDRDLRFARAWLQRELG